MSVADFLATNRYNGKIYMTTNMQSQTIMDYCKTDSAVTKEQARLEQEVTDFEKHIWSPPLDSIAQARKDSIAASQAAQKSKRKRSSSKTQAESKGENVEAEKADSGEEKGNEEKASRASARRKTSSGTEATDQKKTRVTARRQRH